MAAPGGGRAGRAIAVAAVLGAVGLAGFLALNRRELDGRWALYRLGAASPAEAARWLPRALHVVGPGDPRVRAVFPAEYADVEVAYLPGTWTIPAREGIVFGATIRNASARRLVICTQFEARATALGSDAWKAERDLLPLPPAALRAAVVVEPGGTARVEFPLLTPRAVERVDQVQVGFQILSAEAAAIDAEHPWVYGRSPEPGLRFLAPAVRLLRPGPAPGAR